VRARGSPARHTNGCNPFPFPARDIAGLDRACVTVPDFMVPAASVIARLFPSLTPIQAGSRARPKKTEETRDFARRLGASTRICIRALLRTFIRASPGGSRFQVVESRPIAISGCSPIALKVGAWPAISLISAETIGSSC
jgi:hypothetical protein